MDFPDLLSCMYRAALPDDQVMMERLLSRWRRRLAVETDRRLRIMAQFRRDTEQERRKQEQERRREERLERLREERRAERERLWQEWETDQEQTEEEQRRLERELRENEARLRRERREREDWRREEIRAEKERRAQEKREAREREKEEERERRQREKEIEAAREFQKQWPLKWQDVIGMMRRRRSALGQTERLEFDMTLACNAFAVWEAMFPRVAACPLVAVWRSRAVAEFNKWSREAWRSAGYVIEKGSAVAHARIHSPRRRHTLSEYDNKRDSIVLDRYYFGIYSGQYDN